MSPLAGVRDEARQARAHRLIALDDDVGRLLVVAGHHLELAHLVALGVGPVVDAPAAAARASMPAPPPAAQGRERRPRISWHQLNTLRLQSGAGVSNQTGPGTHVNGARRAMKYALSPAHSEAELFVSNCVGLPVYSSGAPVRPVRLQAGPVESLCAAFLFPPSTGGRRRYWTGPSG